MHHSNMTTIILLVYEMKSGGGPAGYVKYISQANEQNPSELHRISIHTLKEAESELSRKKQGSGMKRDRRFSGLFSAAFRNLRKSNFYKLFNALVRIPWLVRRKFYRVLRSYDPSCCVLHINDPIVFCAVHEYAKKLGFQIVFSQHSPLPISVEQGKWSLDSNGDMHVVRISKFFYAIEMYAFRHCDAILSPTPNSMDSYKQYLPGFSQIYSNKLQIVCPTGIDILDAVPKDSSGAVIDERNKLITVGYVGRYEADKGFDIFRQLSHEVDPTKFRFISAGTGSIDPGKLIEDYGWQSEITKFLGLCDVVVIPNRFCYFDLLPLEALALGRILLLSDIGGNKFFEAKSPGIFLVNNNVFEYRTVLYSVAGLSDRDLKVACLGNYNLSRDFLSGAAFNARYLSKMHLFLKGELA